VHFVGGYHEAAGGEFIADNIGLEVLAGGNVFDFGSDFAG
jgi:hypothetical protein